MSDLVRRVRELLDALQLDSRRPSTVPELREHVAAKLRPVLEDHEVPDIGLEIRISPRRGRVDVRVDGDVVRVPVS